MISLAASVGVAFALFAGQALRISVAHKEAAGAGGFPPPRAPDPTGTLNHFLSALLFDVGDTSNEDLTNALRGHSLARSMYGRDPSVSVNGVVGVNTTPWAGVGTFRESVAVGSFTGDRSAAVNYTQMLISGSPFLLDPEVRGTRPFTGTPATRGDLTVGTGREYVGKHAGYSYPDLKDFFLGAVDPVTGQVLTQSFHREWLFNSLAPTNTANWETDAGRLKTLRPRPQDHPRFPRVPQNADLTYTGDVQNWPGGYVRLADPNNASVTRYYGRNDSLWMHIGLPTVQFGNHKVQPLVAPLIVPLDGLLNASVHGNQLLGGPQHFSYAGYGPWEVNLSKVLPNNWAAVIGTRGAASQRNNNNARAYNPYSTGQLPGQSPVVWGAAAVTGPPTYPTGGDIGGLPTFLPATAFLSTNQGVPNHPALFNPAEWPATGTPRTLALSDIKRLHLRYAFTPDWYSQSELATVAQTNLFGTPATYPFIHAPGQTTNPVHKYRLDPAHANRALVTTRSFALARPKVAPNFVDRSGANGLAVGTNADAGPDKPGTVPPGPFPMPSTPGTITDFPSATRWVNQMAALGAVDLNRPLADYRVATDKTLAEKDNVTSASAVRADNDRRKLAHDIFVRLAAATGASLQISLIATEHPTLQYTVPTDISTPARVAQFDALRYLAQLAVNIVDYRDNDDISTAFVWNPINTSNPYAAENFAADQVGNRVVFGFEKPRVVLNEVYSELTNHPSDKPNETDPAMDLKSGATAVVRFWAELLNPTQPNMGEVGLIEDNVSLGAYQIQIARANRKTGAPVADMVTGLYAPANSTGSFPAGQLADAKFPLGTGTNILAVNSVSPNNKNYAPNVANPLPPQGIVLVAPPVEAVKAESEEFNPQAGAGTIWASNNVLYSPSLTSAANADTAVPQGMGYTLTMIKDKDGNLNLNPATAEFRRNVVLLQRLANPYLPADPNVNPYITVDTMDYVPTWDALHRNIGDVMDRGSNPGKPNGYDARANRHSVGKVQPYAGHAAINAVNGIPKDGAGAANWNVYEFPASMVMAQTATPAAEPKHTFGRHNGSAGAPGATTFTAGATATLSDTIMTPYDWLVHMDRPLVNEIEVFQVRDTPPHLVTNKFLQASTATPGVRYDLGLARWRAKSDGIARALEYLTVKPHTSGVAHGGRQAGLININVARDRRVFDALFDPQTGNAFGSTFMDEYVWDMWVKSRDGVGTSTLPSGATLATTGAPGKTPYDDTIAGTNQPFLPLGSPSVQGGSTFAYPSGGNIDQTILRRRDTTTLNNPSFPALYFDSPTPGAIYAPQEPLRKVMNNITTVNHTYLVFLTIGYFELDTVTSPSTVDLGGGTSMPRLGQEAFISVPGDMRQKFVAVVDMSQMALPANLTATGPANVTAPFFTTLEANAYAGTNQLLIAADASGAVWAEGKSIALQNGNQLVIGYGSEQQIVTVDSVTGGGAGMPATVTLSATTPLTRTAWAGSSVSNVRPGYPGVQGADFKYDDPKYKAVVPLVERVK